jgi:DNA-directed RNA polymerase subunit RPC12/RpoP
MAQLNPAIGVPLVFAVVLLVNIYLNKKVDYKCGNCGETFSPTIFQTMTAPHRFGGYKLLKCPHCGKRTWATLVRKP